MNEIKQAKLFYNLMCLAALLIILLPVGIANIIFGYVLGDSPCYLCWGQRESMIFIGVIALFIVRYGLKAKYIAAILIITAFGLYQSFAHFGNHAMRDLDQGFSLAVFGIHTYFWAEVVFWAVIVLLGIMFFFAPKLSSLENELRGKKFRKFSGFTLTSFVICGFIIASNIFQAFVSTGIPPYLGQGDPVRFSLNPKYIIWSTDGWKGNWQNLSFLGKRDVKSPDYAFAPATKLGISFNNNSNESPFKNIDKQLKITDSSAIGIDKPLNSLNYINGEWVASSKFNIYFLDNDFKQSDYLQIDPYFSATIDPIIGVIPYLEDKFMLMGSNKTLLRFGKNPNANEALQYADFIEGASRFEGQGNGLGRGRLDTIRSKFHHTMGMTRDSKYFYLSTVPNNKDKKNFVISKFLLNDRTLSAEFTPKANLKDDRSLGELYVTSMFYHNGLIYALSKNYNVIAEIDIKNEEITNIISFPSEITNARALIIDNDTFKIMSYQNGENKLYTLK